MATDVTNEITNFSHNHTITSAESPAVRRPVTLNLNLSTPIGSSVRSPRSPGEAFRVVNTENMRSVDISFQNLSYSVKTGIRRERKEILKEVCGSFNSGDLTAIMGPSGAGKSTLMDILAGYKKSGYTGSVRVNGKERILSEFKSSSAYIMQDDRLQSLLTVHEAMVITAHLKLEDCFTEQGKIDRINLILEALGLKESEFTRIRQLSGGQRKRLAIAQELVNNPPVMFFDEPTSGLDSSTSYQCVTLLKDLAREGRTVICTIHQPSALLFEMFDQLYVLSEGQCVYQGAIKGLIPFLSSLSLECREYHNPADFLLEVVTKEYGDHQDALVSAIENGRVNDRAHYSITRNDDDMEYGIRRNIVNTPVHAPIFPSYPTRPSPQPPPRFLQFIRKWITRFWLQFSVLFRRNTLLTIRDKSLTMQRTIFTTMIGVLIGVLFYDIGNEGSKVFHNFNLMYFSLMFIMFTAFSSMILSFPLELPIVSREYFNSWYSLESYYLSTSLADLPIQVITTFLYSGIVYYMTSQPLDMVRFSLFFLICILVSFISQTIGMIIGITMNIQNGMVFGPFLIMPFTIFAGFFLQIKDAPKAFHWVFHINYLKYALDALMQSIYGLERPKLACNADYCHHQYPIKFLKELGMEQDTLRFDIFFLISVLLSLRVLSYLLLMYRVRFRR